MGTESEVEGLKTGSPFSSLTASSPLFSYVKVRIHRGTEKQFHAKVENLCFSIRTTQAHGKQAPPRSQGLCYLGVSRILDHCHILNFFNSLYVPTPLPGLSQRSLPISGLCDLRVLQFPPFSTTPSSSLTALHFPSSIKGAGGRKS